MTETNESKGAVDVTQHAEQPAGEAAATPPAGTQPPDDQTVGTTEAAEAAAPSVDAAMDTAANTMPADTASPAEPPEAASTSDDPSDEVAAPEAGASAAPSNDASEGAGAAEAAEASTEAAAEAEAASSGEQPKKKRKRRRRRKKKKAAGDGAEAAATEGGAAQGTEEGGQRAEAPLARWFEGHGREHAFKKDEIVAGRLLEVREDGVLVLDLFGKGTAFMDAREPVEIADLPTPPQQPETAKTAETGEPADAEAAEEAAPGTDEAGAAAAEAASSASPDDASAETATGTARPDGTVVHAQAVAVPSSAAEESAATEDTPETPSDGGEAQAAPEPAEAAPAVAASDTEEPAAEATDTGPSDGEVTAAQGSAEGQSAPSEAQAAQQTATEEPAGPPPDTLFPETPPERTVGQVVMGRIRSVADSGHMALVNRPVDRRAAKAALAAAREQGEKVEGIVFGFNRGGFDVLVQGIRAFCPASGMSLQPIEDPLAFLGRKLLFSVAPRKGSSIVVSRRSQLEKERRKRIKERLAELKPGERVRGTVTQVRDFGLIVDIGDGVEGLVHLSELSWKRGVKPSEVAEVGQEIEVEVLQAVPPSRKERHGKLSLSRRATLPDPWEQHPEVLREGVLLELPVVRVTDFGAFLEMADGIDGLLPASEIVGRDKAAKPADHVSVGDRLKVVVERVDRKGHKIWLSKPSELELKWLEEGVFDPEKRPKSLKPGNHVQVLVVRSEHAGIVVQVQGVLGRRGRGFLPNRELVGEDGPIDRKSLQPGTELTVKIVGTDRTGGLRCSIRARLLDEERRAVREYRKEAARQGFGTFGDLLRAKLGGGGEESPGR